MPPIDDHHIRPAGVTALLGGTAAASHSVRGGGAGESATALLEDATATSELDDDEAGADAAPPRAGSGGDIGAAQLLVSDAAAATMFGISRATFWRRVKDGTFPPPVKIAGVTRWRRDELCAVIDRLTAARDGGAS